MQQNQNDFYQNIREGIKDYLKTEEGKTNKFAELLLLVPDMFHLLCKLTIEKEVAISDKAKLAGPREIVPTAPAAATPLKATVVTGPTTPTEPVAASPVSAAD